MSDETGCVNGAILLPYPSYPSCQQPNELQTLLSITECLISMSHAQQPTARARPGLSAAVGNVLAWRRCATSSVIAGIGQMSLSGNVVSANGLSFIVVVCRLRILPYILQKKKEMVNLFFFPLQAPMSACTTMAAALIFAMT